MNIIGNVDMIPFNRYRNLRSQPFSHELLLTKSLQTFEFLLLFRLLLLLEQLLSDVNSFFV